MIHRLIYAANQKELDSVQTLLTNGYELDPEYAKPIHMELALVYPLVLYESEEERPKPVDESKPSEFDDVLETREIPHGLVPEGFRVHAVYQKNLIVVRRKPAQPVPAGVV